jgi:type IV secretion system protein VirD4
MKIRLYLFLVLLLLDLLLLPPVLGLPNYFKAYGIKAGAFQWKQEILERPWAGPLNLTADGKVRAAWFWAQPLLGAAVLSLFTRQGRRRGKKSDCPGGPPAAGEGQFGTSRWQTGEEINSSFKMVGLPLRGVRGKR